MKNMFRQPLNKFPKNSSGRGFSMIELVITIAIAAVLLTLAIPSFTSFLNSNRVSGQANELLATFQTARLESIRRGRQVVVCGSSNANAATPSCSGTAAWGGWISFVDTNSDQAFNTGETLLQANLLSGVTATASSNINAFITFQSDGLARRSNGNLLQGKVGLCVPTTTPLLNTRDVEFATGGGSLRVAKRNAGISCTAPSN